MDHLHQLEIFTRVVERGSLSRAARDLGITQPTVSKALSALERLLSTQLVLRTTRTLAVTDAGRRYYERARQALGTLEDARAEIAETTAPAGTLRVHAPVVLGEFILAPAAVAFQQAHPRVRFHLTFLDQFVDLVAEGADLAIRVGSVTDSSVVYRRLGTMRRVLVASPALLASRGVPKEPLDLRAFPSIRYPNFGLGDRLPLTGPGGETVVVEQRPGFLANNAVGQLHGLLGGLGVGTVPAFLVQAELASGALVEVLPRWVPPEAGLNAVFPSGRYIPSRSRRFVEFLARRLKKVAGVTVTEPDEGH